MAGIGATLNGGGFTLQSLAQAGIDFSNLTTQVFVANVSEFDECKNTLEPHYNSGFGGVRSETIVIEEQCYIEGLSHEKYRQ